MLKTLAWAMLWLILLLVLALLCWAGVLSVGWPVWAAPAMFIGVLAGAWLLRAVSRAWRAWRVRRKLVAAAGAPTEYDPNPAVDSAWRSGLRVLKRSRLARFGGAIYALPWFLVVGKAASGKSALLTRTRLSSAVRLVNQSEPVEPTAVIDWWYFDRSVVIEPAGHVFDSHDPRHARGAWQRLLRWFWRARRREPLNGIVLAVSARDLLTADAQRLAEDGQEARARIDALTRVFNARIPTYIVLTHCDAIEGFVAWGRSLPEPLLAMPLGVSVRSESACHFVGEVIGGLRERLAQIRLKQGKFDLPDSEALFFPEHVSELEDALLAYLSPAFEANPYGETPLLRGLYLTAEVTQDSHAHELDDNRAGHGAAREAPLDPHACAVPRGWFSSELFDKLLPSQRDAYEPLTRFRLWRRFLRHAAVIAWLSACIGFACVMTWNYADTRAVLSEISTRSPRSLDYSGDLLARFATLAEYDAVNRLLDDHQARFLNRWMPFSPQLNRVSDAYRSGFCAAFEKYALREGIDSQLSAHVPVVAKGGPDSVLAAYAQHYARRINLIDAALAGQPLDRLPLPGGELPAIESDLHPGTPFDAQIAAYFEQIYPDYLRWQANRNALALQRLDLRNAFNRLALLGRSPDWLLAWADLQGDLAPVTLASFWNISDRAELPRVPSAYTAAGHQAINGFLGELAKAGGNDPLWVEQRRVFETRFDQALNDTWLRFAVDFNNSRNYLQDESQWRGALASMLTAKGPYIRLLATISTTFREVRALDRDGTHAPMPEWVKLAMRLNGALDWSIDTAGAGSAGKGALGYLRLTNLVGKTAVDTATGVTTRFGQVRGDVSLARELADYQRDIAAAIEEIQKGNGHALKVAGDTYSFANNANIKETPLISAARRLDSLELRDKATAADVTAWNLVRGPLDFVLDYAGRAAACVLQHDWQTQVLAPVQGVSDPEQIAQILYSDSGALPTFMSGPVQAFVDRDASGYRPREVMGQTLPLNGLFYSFASEAQQARLDAAQSRKDVLEQQKTDDALKQRRQTELQSLNQEIGSMSARIDQLSKTAGVVKITALPIVVNPGATSLPEQTTLALQCTSAITTLDNYNFPVSAAYNWSLATCGDVTLTFEFPGVTLVKRWKGPRAFIDFLRASADGRYKLDLASYPEAQKALAASKVTWVAAVYKQEGQESLLAAFAEIDRLNGQLQMLTSRRDRLRAEGGATDANLASDDEILQERSASEPPTVIAACWQPPRNLASVRSALPASTVRSSQESVDVSIAPASGGRAVASQRSSADTAGAGLGMEAPDYVIQVGLFANPSRAQAQLKAMGLNSETTAMPRPNGDALLYWVRVPGFRSREEAQAAAGRIEEALDLKPRVLASGGK
ncbi:type VI secretion protein IcmF/TssM N-terminal domain-containing protein [Burkholderia sp. WSM2232]|uniref:type VI secretion protein IcmF/TssM N-terminal domain-containing protein n=1 Tax=Burkholderia sp. WSM2232 TaxID=944436 RepID=UPI0003F8D757|nr:type VI secretion protein IcmF/TssM N-terminal domain-containing protein [Burkholderia sp. WSM2232]